MKEQAKVKMKSSLIIIGILVLVSGCSIKTEAINHSTNKPFNQTQLNLFKNESNSSRDVTLISNNTIRMTFELALQVGCNNNTFNYSVSFIYPNKTINMTLADLCKKIR